jgi:transposase-like protein
MRVMTKHYPVEQRERAVKMVLDHLDEYRSVYAACRAIGPKVGVGAESLRRWTLQAQVDASQRPGVTSAEQQRIKELEREVRDLKEANEILKALSSPPRRPVVGVLPPVSDGVERISQINGNLFRGNANVELQSPPPSGPVPHRTEHSRMEIADEVAAGKLVKQQRAVERRRHQFIEHRVLKAPVRGHRLQRM